MLTRYPSGCQFSPTLSTDDNVHPERLLCRQPIMHLNYLAHWLLHNRCLIALAIFIIIGNTQKVGNVIGT